MPAIFPGSSENANPLAGRPDTDEETAAACHALAHAASERNVCIRIAIGADGSVEPFVLRVPDSLKPKTEAYDPDLTHQTLSKALANAPIKYNELIEKLQTSGRAATQNVPPAVMWSEPGLVIGGFAKGFVEQWQKLKHDNRPRA